jgi:hypothetical protein
MQSVPKTISYVVDLFKNLLAHVIFCNFGQNWFLQGDGAFGIECIVLQG